MTRRAATHSVEIAVPGRGISDGQIRGVHGAAPAAKRFGLGLLVVDESDDRSQIRIAQAESRHTLVRASSANQRSDLITAIVFGDQLGASKVRPCFSACRVTAMAEAALRAKSQLAGLNLLDRVGLRRNGLRWTLRGRALRGIAGRSFRLTLGRRFGALRHDRAHGKNGNRQDPQNPAHPPSNTGEYPARLQLDPTRRVPITYRGSQILMQEPGRKGRTTKWPSRHDLFLGGSKSGSRAIDFRVLRCRIACRSSWRTWCLFPHQLQRTH